MAKNWQPIETAPELQTVWTKIDDKDGCRNEVTLRRYRNLWFLPDGSMYVYYAPAYWAVIE